MSTRPSLSDALREMALDESDAPDRFILEAAADALDARDTVLPEQTAGKPPAPAQDDELEREAKSLRETFGMVRGPTGFDDWDDWLRVALAARTIHAPLLNAETLYRQAERERDEAQRILLNTGAQRDEARAEVERLRESLAYAKDVDALDPEAIPYLTAIDAEPKSGCPTHEDYFRRGWIGATEVARLRSCTTGALIAQDDARDRGNAQGAWALERRRVHRLGSRLERHQRGRDRARQADGDDRSADRDGGRGSGGAGDRDSQLRGCRRAAHSRRPRHPPQAPPRRERRGRGEGD
jgi:hypothetical protein